MIQAKEVRLGNWIFDPRHKGGSFCKIQMGDFANAEEDGEDSFDYEPIPLTPEILEKAGFVQQHDTFDWSIGYQFQINGYFTLISRNNTLYYIDAINLEVKHLHQLQNLFFALTGEELQIEL